MKFTEDALVIDRCELRALLAFASSDDTRPQMESIHIEPDRGRVYATDGHRLLMLESEPGDGTPYAIPARAMARAMRVFAAAIQVRHGDGAITLDDDPCARMISSGCDLIVLTMPARAVEPPPIDSVLASVDMTSPPVSSYSLNAKYLSDVRLIGELGSSRSNGISLHAPRGDHGPVLVTATSDDGTEATGLLMPIRMHVTGGRSVTCETCNAAFSTARADAKYCSSPCRQKAYRERQLPEAAE
jgi:hypothetical protein